MVKKISLAAAAVLLAIIVFEGCYYDKADVQYPSPGGCDTASVLYTVQITAILDASCKSCHDGTNSVSGIDLYDYNTISTLALDGRFTYGTLLSAVMHQGGAPAMPQGAPKLSDCDINTIAAWVNRGAPNN